MKSFKIYNEGEISLFNTVRYFLKVSVLKVLFKYGVVGVIVGLIIALTTPETYTSGTTLMPHTSETGPMGNLGSLSNIAGLAGIDLAKGSSTSRFPINLYPNVIQSRAFKEKLLETYFDFEEDSITFRTYIEEESKPSLFGFIKSIPWKILSAFREERERVKQGDLIVVDKETKKLYANIESLVSLTIDEDYYLVQINVTTQNPALSLAVTEFVKEYLIDYIEEFSVIKLTEELSFLEEAIAAKKEELNIVENELSRLIERNQNIRSKKVELDIRNKEEYYALIFSSLSALQEQYEAAKLTKQKDTPSFSVLNPIFLPVEKSSLSRFLILTLVAILIVLFSVIKIFIQKLKEDISES